MLETISKYKIIVIFFILQSAIICFTDTFHSITFLMCHS